MHLYWRVQQDLDCLGEVIQFRDPAFIRALRNWMRKHIERLAGIQYVDSCASIGFHRN